MRSLARLALVGVLVAGMLNLSTMAAAAKPLGMVVTAENAHLGELNAAMGTNIFAGDSLQTDSGGTLRLRVGSNQLYLPSASFATLLEEPSKIRVKLIRGTAGFSSPIANHFEIETPVGTVRAAKDTSAFGEVTILGPQKILVAAYHGSIVVSNAGMDRTIREGDAYNISLAQGPQGAETGNDDSSGNSNGSGPYGKGGHFGVRSYQPLIFTLVVGGALAGLGYALWHFTSESNYTPN